MVGALIGALLVVLDAAASQVLSRPVVDALLVTALAAATGALHLDGLIDSVDGLTARPAVQDRLDAMRRTVAGVPGAVAGCAMVLATYVAIGTLGDGVRAPALLLAPICGRATILLGYSVYAYGRDEPTVSQALKDGATGVRSAVGLAGAFAVAAAIAGSGGVVLLALGAAGGLSLGRAALRRLPGLTGDVHGAICEVIQLGVLLTAPLVLAR